MDRTYSDRCLHSKVHVALLLPRHLVTLHRHLVFTVSVQLSHPITSRQQTPCKIHLVRCCGLMVFPIPPVPNHFQSTQHLSNREETENLTCNHSSCRHFLTVEISKPIKQMLWSQGIRVHRNLREDAHWISSGVDERLEIGLKCCEIPFKLVSYCSWESVISWLCGDLRWRHLLSLEDELGELKSNF